MLYITSRLGVACTVAMRVIAGSSLLSLLLLAGCGAAPEMPVGGPAAEWPVYGGAPGGARYSPLMQIDQENVSQLEVVPGQLPEAPPTVGERFRPMVVAAAPTLEIRRRPPAVAAPATAPEVRVMPNPERAAQPAPAVEKQPERAPDPRVIEPVAPEIPMMSLFINVLS